MEKKQPELSDEGVLKILIQDEMCSCLCTTHFPPQWRALSSTGCLSSAARPAVIKAARASSVCGAGCSRSHVGKQTWLGWVPGSKKGEKQQRMEENTSK